MTELIGFAAPAGCILPYKRFRKKRKWFGQLCSLRCMDALERFLAMREKEGQKMQADLVGRLDAIERMVTQVEALSPETVQQYYDPVVSKVAGVAGRYYN